MKNVILLTPLTGNGGIASWSRKFIKTFHNPKYQIIPIDRSVKGRTFEDNRIWMRFYAGIKEMIEIKKKAAAEIKKQKIDILHTTTSGSFGTFRDYLIAKLCKRNNVRTIMHCHYGCISDDVKRNLYGWFLRMTMRQYSQIWVLDKRSLNTLKAIKGLEDKVFLTPNSIEVNDDVKIGPKTYRHVAFVANLVPSKGLYELVEAVVRLDRDDLRLSIVGKGADDVVVKVKDLAGDKLGKTIHLLGLIPNENVLEFMKDVDMLALPTYMSHEAFPISILEAMSQGKLIISTRRAAIEDMLTGLDGTPCGCFVRERSVDDIIDVIKWCMDNTVKADELCHKAYEKVRRCYRMEIVYDTYKSLYSKLY